MRYAYGRYLWAYRDAAAALAAFLMELGDWPKHVLARCQMANIKLQCKAVQEGLK